MNLPGFNAEFSLYRSDGRYRSPAAAQQPGSDVQMQMLRSRFSGLHATSGAFAPTCYLDGLETSCDVVFGCLRAGWCELVYYQP